MEQVGTNSIVGNTNSTMPEKKGFKCRRWCLTLNNWDITEWNGLITYFKNKRCKYIVGKEVGESGTPHLQIYSEFHSPVNWNGMKKLNKRLHIEKAIKDRKTNLLYCSKDDDYETNFKKTDFMDERKFLLDRYYKDITWRPFQDRILKVVKSEPDERKVYWVWEKVGNKGKSFLCRYLNLKYKNVIICDGKKGDVLNSIKAYQESEDYDFTTPMIILMDIPRHYRNDINYGVLEQLKNGFVYSGKYEGRNMNFLTPHIFCFANFEPHYERWSRDRWLVLDINESLEDEESESESEIIEE